MNVLVTGGAGFFGSWLVPALKDAGHIVEVYDKKNNPDDRICEITRLKEKLKDVDAVIHLAAIPHAYPKVPPSEYRRVNTRGTLAVALASVSMGVKKFVFTSSGAVYGFEKSDKGFVEPPITEKDYPLLPEDVKYGLSKQEAEKNLYYITQAFPDFTVTCLRINLIEGQYPAHKPPEACHHGWYCTQKLAVKAYLSALKRSGGGCFRVNVAEKCGNMDQTNLEKLFNGE